MPKKSRAKQKVSNKNVLQQYIEEGKSIAGLVGYVKTTLYNDDEELPICLKAKIIRQQMTEKGCGIVIVATPISGDGEFVVNPAAVREM